jgi:glycosyltransferase involved in cell wall biosynthesis
MRKLLASGKLTLSAISNHNRNLLARYYDISAKLIPVVPNRPRPESKGKTTSPYERQRSRNAFLLEQHLPSNSTIVLTVAALHFQKGIDILLRGAREFTSELPNVYFCIAGDGEDASKLKELAADLKVDKSVRFLGHRTDIDSLLHISDIFLFPTRYEGESFALLEAARSRLPIVASATSGIPETFRNGIDALLFNAEDYKDMSEKIRQLLLCPSLAKTIADSAVYRVKEFREEDMLNSTLSILENRALGNIR